MYSGVLIEFVLWTTKRICTLETNRVLTSESRVQTRFSDPICLHSFDIKKCLPRTFPFIRTVNRKYSIIFYFNTRKQGCIKLMITFKKFFIFMFKFRYQYFTKQNLNYKTQNVALFKRVRPQVMLWKYLKLDLN